MNSAPLVPPHDAPNHPPHPEEDRDEGGLHAPVQLRGWRRVWWWFDFLVLVNLARLRFVAILAVIGWVITQWSTLTAYYEKWTQSAHAAQEEGEGLYEYFCPMHPTVIRDNSKEKCPICFMPLSRRERGGRTSEPLPPGTVSRVQLTPYRIALAGVTTATVDFVPLAKTIRSVGYLEFDERRQVTIAARVKGRLDELIVNETGQLVEAGDPLAKLYSPDLLVTFQTLLDANRAKTPSFVESSRARLKLWGIDEEQINEILQRGQVDPQLTIRAPLGGHVIAKYVRAGQYVDEGMPLYDIADLTTIWLLAQIHEEDVALLPLEQSSRSDEAAVEQLEVSATTTAFPGEVFQGQVSLVYPHFDQNSRTLTIRVELENTAHKLRPGGTAEVHLRIPARQIRWLRERIVDEAAVRQLHEDRVLAIPEAAVIDTGKRQVVYQEVRTGIYEGREVQLGPRLSAADGQSYYPIWEGLSAGDRIVLGGAFLIDAETRLNPAAGSIYSGGGKSAPDAETVRPSTKAAPNATASKAATVTPEIKRALTKLSVADRRLAEAQGVCVILPDNPLGSMGVPIKLTIEGRVVFVCCEGCRRSALAQPAETLKKLDALTAQRAAPSEGGAP